MSTFDFNTAEPQQAGAGSLIPDNTIVTVVSTLRPGGHGPGGWLKTNSNGSCLMADFEFTIAGGPFDRRKVWSMFVTEGETDGQKTAAEISRSKLRAMLESAFAINPDDASPEAMKARFVSGWNGFDGLRFCAKLGIEKGKPKDPSNPHSEIYPDRNTLKAIITPNEKDYVHPGAQMVKAPAANSSPTGAPSSMAPAANKPKWAS